MNRRILLAFLTFPTLVSSSLWMVVMPAYAEASVSSTIVALPNATAPDAQHCKSPQDVLPTTSQSTPRSTPQSAPRNALQAQTIGSGTNLLDPIVEFKFTDAESDAAVARFGCDCPRHIMAIRSLCASTSPAT